MYHSLFKSYDHSGFLPGSHTDVAEETQNFRIWLENEEVLSDGVALATISPPQSDLEIVYDEISRINHGFPLAVPGLPFGDRSAAQGWDRLNQRAQTVMGRLVTTFAQLVEADVARTPDMRAMQARGYIYLTNTPSRVPGHWHADNMPPNDTERIFDKGTKRYVLSFGENNAHGEPPTTRFLRGAVTFEETTAMQDTQDPSVIRRLRQIAYPAGTIACFSGTYGLHSAPASDGPRIFMTTSTLIIPDELRRPRAARRAA